MKQAITLAICILASQLLFCQNNDTYPTREEVRHYKIQYDFGDRVTNLYKMTYTTKVNRSLDDNSTKSYERTIELFISYWRPTSPTDGFAEVKTTLDSIHYLYKGDTTNIVWSSQDDDFFIPDVTDFDNVFAIMGREFYTTISPYFEVAKIESESLTEARDNIDKMSDSILQYIWKKANTDDNLIFLTDMNKGVVHSGRYAVDSTWRTKFTIPIEGVRYTCDTATVLFEKYDGKDFYFKADIPKMYPNTVDYTNVIGLNRILVPVDSKSYSTGYWEMCISPRGLVRTANGTFTTKAIAEYNKHKWTDDITTEIKFEFISNKRWVE
ncbi:MAG: hypothetical protein LBO69_04470 [Ignavibacteria bacterium]|jgi:hypothetical protein|nr:hypothetical protein [Ignavibacteria bacterium]